MTGNRTHSAGAPVVVGVADHGGWAVLVSAAAVDGVPAVIDRRRVPLIEKGMPTQPYHHDTLAMSNEAGEQLVRNVKRSAAACTKAAFDRLSADLSPQYRVTAIAIRQPPLPELPATLAAVHASYYVQCRADGMLYHSAICAAARDRDWEVVLHRRGGEVAAAAEALKVSAAEVERFLRDMRLTLQPPWTAEHRNALAAAISELKKHSRLRVPRSA